MCGIPYLSILFGEENMIVGKGKAGGRRQRADGNEFVKILILNSKF